MKQRKTEKMDLTVEGSPLQSLASTALSQLDSSLFSESLPTRTSSEPAVSKEVRVRSQRFVLRREKKDRGGKTVVVISGYNGHPEALDDLARNLRKQLGCGGTVEQKEIVIQGDQLKAVADALTRMGHQVRGERQ